MRRGIWLRSTLLLAAILLIIFVVKLVWSTGLGPMAVLWAIIILLVVILQGIPYLVRRFLRGYRGKGSGPHDR